MRKHISTILLILVFLIGLSLLLYPTVSDYWNSFHRSRAITGYAEDVAQLEDTDYSRFWADAQAYNRTLPQNEMRYTPTEQEHAAYEALLDVSGTGIIGSIEIPSIDCSLPIYHGTDEAVLQIAIGHIEGSSLPVGGESTHCVLSGHRGLPSAKLFTNLDQMDKGDTFTLQVLDEVLTYEVDQIRIVEPHDTRALDIEEGKDYCTLVTCTPYGINSHRLLVRGRRIASKAASSVRVTADAMQIEPVLVAPLVAAPMLLLLLAGLFAAPLWKKKR